MKKLKLFGLLFFSAAAVSAQSFAPALNGTSHSKTSYVTLTDGKTIEGTIKDLDRKKGLIEELKIVDLSGKKHKLKPEDVKYMYLPPTNFAKLNSAADQITTVNKWDDGNSVDKDIISKGYVYFEMIPVKIKKKTTPMLMQLLNPSFNAKVQVYDDPFAKETMSVGVGAFDVAGGDKKSYYIKYGDVAYRIYKKNYDEEYKLIFKDCPALVEKLDAKAKWTDLAKHIYEFTNSCSNL